MAAKQYHFCQSCKQLISPSINDDRLKERGAVIRHLQGQTPPTGHHVWSDHCPKCGAPWPLKLLRVGRQPIARLTRSTAVLSELQTPDRTGWTNRYANYKKLQQAKAKANNTTPKQSHGKRLNPWAVRNFSAY